MKKFLILIIIIFGTICISNSSPQQVTHGPIAGAVTESSAGFVVRTDNQASVSIQLSVTEDFQSPLISDNSVTLADSGFFCKIYVNGLQPDTRYYYRALINGSPPAEEAIKYFSTFPIPGTRKVFTFLSGSCQKQNGTGNIYTQMALEDPRFFIQQGDWGYPDTTVPVFSSDFLKVQESYISRYSQNYPMVHLLRKTAVDYTYDDHDMAGNNSDGSAIFSEAIVNSLRGYRSFFPNYPLPDGDKGLWHKFTFGNVDVFMLDNRSQRDPNINAIKAVQDSFYFAPDAGHSILGEQQMNWLLEELDKSTADWKFISSGTPFNPSLISAIELGVQLQKDPRYQNFPTPYGNFGMKDIVVELADKWAGFPEDISRLISYIKDKNINNIIFLTGDTHTSGIDDGNNSVFPELMAGPLDIRNNGFVYILELFGISVFNSGGHTFESGQFNLGSAYGRITVFEADSVLIEVVSENGKVIGKNTVKKNFIPVSVSATAVPNSVNFGTVSISGKKTQPLVITCNSTDTLVISEFVINDPHFSVSTQLPLKVAPFGKSFVGITYTPTNAGVTNTGQLIINSNAENIINPINLTAIASQSTGMNTDKAVETFELYQNFPNPFNPSTNIAYYVPERTSISLVIYDSFGREIRLLDQGFREAGLHNIVWDGTSNSGNKVSSGIYFMRLKAGNFHSYKKIVLVK